MSRLFRLFLVAFLMIPPSVSGAPVRPPEDCVLCGHVCCCPEVCQATLSKACATPVSACALSADRSSPAALNERRSAEGNTPNADRIGRLAPSIAVAARVTNDNLPHRMSPVLPHDVPPPKV